MADFFGDEETAYGLIHEALLQACGASTAPPSVEDYYEHPDVFPVMVSVVIDLREHA